MREKERGNTSARFATPLALVILAAACSSTATGSGAASASFESIEALNNCRVDIRPILEAPPGIDHEADLYYSSSVAGKVVFGVKTNGSELEIGDINGVNRVKLEDAHSIEVSYYFDGSAHKARIKVNHATASKSRTYDPAPVTGAYTGIWSSSSPRVDPREVIGVDKYRHRIWINLYGLETAFTLQDVP